MEYNALEDDPIDIYQHQLPNVEDTDTDTSTNQQQDIVDIKPTAGSDSNVSAVVVASQEGTSDTDEVLEPTLWFIKIPPLFSFFEKSVSCLPLCLEHT